MSEEKLIVLESEESGEALAVRKVMHVLLEADKGVGKIATRLWPAAEHLAEFVLQNDRSTTRSSAAEVQRQPEIWHPQSKNSQKQPAVEQCLKQLQQYQEYPYSLIMELGAGVGLTGLEIATQRKSKVLLTDLDDALPILQINMQLNFPEIQTGAEAQRLAWGNDQDIAMALQWWKANRCTKDQPLLLLASDCVYWEELHAPLEYTLAQLLQALPEGSMALVAGVRRWKRDNLFFKTIGKRTRTQTHALTCTCLKETVTRATNISEDFNNEDDDEQQQQRSILRVFAIEWKPRL